MVVTTHLKSASTSSYLGKPTAFMDSEHNFSEVFLHCNIHRCYDIVNEKKNLDKYEDSIIRMRWIKVAELIEVRRLQHTNRTQGYKAQHLKFFPHRRLCLYSSS